MPYRIQPPTRADLPTPEAQQTFDHLTQIGTRSFGPRETTPFTWQLPSGALVGPFPALLENPSVATAFLALNAAIGAIPGLEPAVKEIAIVATGAQFRAAYELYAHKAMLEKAGFSKEEVEMVARGEKPEGLSEACGVAFEVATWLSSSGKGPLRGEVWERAKAVLGLQATLALVHYVGFYAHTCVLLNAVDAPVPE